MRSSAGVLAAVVLAVPAVGSVASVAAVQSTTGDWRDVLARAVDAARHATYEGGLVVITHGPDGPRITEVDVSQADGELRMGRAESWFIGRDGDEAVFGDAGAGRLLRLGSIEQGAFDLDRIATNYVVTLGRDRSGVGEAMVVAFSPRGTGTVRERLFVDDGSGLVVRRETFAADGTGIRLAAFTSLRTATTQTPMELSTTSTHAMAMSPEGIAVLRDIGWAVPEGLPGGFTLVSATAVGESVREVSLRAVYGDGLYSVSVFQQPGALDREALGPGAVAVRAGDGVAYHWPGAQPERMVWSAGDATFTAVSDAPADMVVAAITGLPHEPSSSFGDRVVRGVKRVASWLWPFS